MIRKSLFALCFLVAVSGWGAWFYETHKTKQEAKVTDKIAMVKAIAVNSFKHGAMYGSASTFHALSMKIPDNTKLLEIADYSLTISGFEDQLEGGAR